MENNIISVLESSELVNDEAADKYLYNGVYVPRVNTILSSMLHEDYLMKWSNSMGLYRHTKYEDILASAANIGTIVHEAIERYIKTGEVLKKENTPPEAYNAFQSFLEWWGIVNTHDCKVLLEEQPLVCQYFGGTLDLYMEIDGKKYLIDFKTSNHPSYKYFLQLSAYDYMLKLLYGYDTDGYVILRLDKKKSLFEEYMLDLEVPSHLAFVNDCKNAFLSLVYAYYNRLNVQYQYDTLF